MVPLAGASLRAEGEAIREASWIASALTRLAMTGYSSLESVLKFRDVRFFGQGFRPWPLPYGAFSYVDDFKCGDDFAITAPCDGEARRTRPKSGRKKGLFVRLSKSGEQLMNKMIVEHIENEKRQLACLTQEDRLKLNNILKTLISHWTADDATS
jgi:hypothetical protein